MGLAARRRMEIAFDEKIHAARLKICFERQLCFDSFRSQRVMNPKPANSRRASSLKTKRKTGLWFRQETQIERERQFGTGRQPDV